MTDEAIKTASPHNLDEVNEYFEFKVIGHIYRFRYMTTEELEQLMLIQEDGVKSQEYIFKFIDKGSPDSPEFNEVVKKMTPKHWQAFQKMIVTEFKG